MKVKDLMTGNVVCAKENTPVAQIAAHMRKNNIGSLPICDDLGHLKGIVTDRDLVLRVLARQDRRLLTAADIMTKNPVFISPDDNIHDAALMFSSYQVRRLPVMEASKIVGMLSLGDVAARPGHIDEAGDALSAISRSDGLQGKN